MLTLAPQPVSPGAKHGNLAQETDPTAPAILAEVLKGMDSVAHGMALLNSRGQVLYANAAARALIARSHNRLTDLMAFDPGAHPGWRSAFEKCCHRGRRELVLLPTASGHVYVALVPVGTSEQPMVFATFARDELCGAIELQMFASHHGLTLAEGHVLCQLCRGLHARQIAGENGVATTTVLTQIAAIRSKTSNASVRGLLEALARMPPLTPMASLMQ